MGEYVEYCGLSSSELKYTHVILLDISVRQMHYRHVEIRTGRHTEVEGTCQRSRSGSPEGGLQLTS